MSWIPYHPAPGFGELVPGAFVVPQNPIVDTKDPSVSPDSFAGNGSSGVKYIPRMAEILPSRFAVPQNPLIAQLRAGMSSLMGCCCGDGGSGSKGAAPDDQGTAYVNGQPVMGGGIGEFIGGLDLQTLLIGGFLGALALGMFRRR